MSAYAISLGHSAQAVEAAETDETAETATPFRRLDQLARGSP